MHAKIPRHKNTSQKYSNVQKCTTIKFQDIGAKKMYQQYSYISTIYLILYTLIGTGVDKNRLTKSRDTAFMGLESILWDLALTCLQQSGFGFTTTPMHYVFLFISTNTQSILLFWSYILFSLVFKIIAQDCFAMAKI